MGKQSLLPIKNDSSIHISHDVWLYQNIRGTLSDVFKTTSKLDIEHNELLIFFISGRFDGFMWFHQNLDGKATTIIKAKKLMDF